MFYRVHTGYAGATGRLCNILTDNIILSGRYELIRLLGTGAFGSVYLARHVNLNVFRAIKCVELSHNSYAMAYREANILKNLRHPSIPIIYDIEEDDNCIYIIEEYINGQSLTDFISKQKLNIRRITDIILQLCDILSYMHDNNTYHLDIKPENIIIDGGTIKLIDYGSAVSNGKEPEFRTGTKGYASPEMYGRDRIESGSDVYSLGVLMLYMITGRRDAKAVNSITNPHLKKIVEQCICHNQNERIKSFDIIKKKLNQFIKKDLVENVTLNIHIGGVMGHCGTTHCALAVNRIMKSRGYNSILCDNNDNGDYFSLIKEWDFKFSQGIFNMQGNAILPNYYGYVNMDFLNNYNRIIKDFGCINTENLNEFLSGDMIFLVSGAKPYEINKLREFIKSVLQPLIIRLDYRNLINFSSPAEYRRIVRKYGIPNPVRVPYEPDVLKSKKDWLS